MTKPDGRLMMMLEALRGFNDYNWENGDLTVEAIAIERTLSDRVMFNIGWYSANPATELKGLASTEGLLKALLEGGELARDVAHASRRVQAADAKLRELNKPGRKKGSYKDWHFEPGYSVVVAMIETKPKKNVAEHIRWGVKNKWLDESINDKTHARRIELIQKRLEAEERARVERLGKNVVKLVIPKKRKHKNRPE